MRNLGLALFTAVPLISCTTVPNANPAFQKVSVRALHDHPEQWAGKSVEVSGIAVRQFENYGLYEPVADPCVDDPIGIYVDWNDSTLPYKTTRRGTFRGIFTDENGKVRNGMLVISNAAPGPGPLTAVKVVSWAGPPMYRCS